MFQVKSLYRSLMLICGVVLAVLLLDVVFHTYPLSPIPVSAATEALSCVKGKNGIGGGGCSGTATLKLKPGGVISSSAGYGLRVNTTSETADTAALYGVQGAGSGITDQTFSPAAIRGDTKDDYGILGTANLGTGVVGYSQGGVGVVGESISADGVWGLARGYGAAGVHAESQLGPALVATSDLSGGVAIDITAGGIQVQSAGINTSTPVFIHKAITGGSGNICSIQNYATVVNNPLANNKPHAILIITPNYGPNSAGVAPPVSPMAVYYDDLNQCGKGSGHWVIYTLNATAIPNNAMFNVLIVQP
jgi:hypothetical protein